LNQVQISSSQVGEQTVKSRYNKLDTERRQHLDRARLCAQLTVPHLLPPEGHINENTPLYTPYQGLGARAVNNLAAKLLLSLLPPNSPFFRLMIERSILEELKAQLGQEDFKTQVENQLSTIEHSIAEYIEATAVRVPAFKALRLLIVTGNTCCYLPDEGGMKVYKLDQYVCKRDPMGRLIELIIKESVNYQALPSEIQEGIKPKVEATKLNEDLEIYTHIKRINADTYEVDQEVAGVKLSTLKDEVSGTYKADTLPWLVLRWAESEGENYGRGHVEEYLGDFNSLERLSQAIVDFAAAASKIIFLVNPNGVTSEDDLMDTPNTGFCTGVATDVSALQVEKYADFQVASSTSGNIEKRIAQAFLLNSSVQRDGERVTAEEIRFLAQELEDSLGGIYSILSLEFQLPLVRRIMHVLTKSKKIPKLPPEVKPSITTGLEALGRGHDLNKLLTFVDIATRMGPEAIARIKLGNYLTRTAIGLGIDVDGLVMSDDEFNQMQAQAMEQAKSDQIETVAASEAAKSMASA
jgi:hypothetical protein